MSRSFTEALEQIPEGLTVSPQSGEGRLDGAARLLAGGVGGSAAAGDVLDLLRGSARPTRVLREAALPSDVRSDDEVLVISYSGDTEESLALWREAAKQGLARAAVASGGALLALAREERRPWAKVPAGEAPRTALGFLVRAAAHLAGDPPADWSEASAHLSRIRAQALTPTGPAQNLAEALMRGRATLLSGDDVGHAAARRWASSLAENAKVAADRWPLPEAGHNLVMAASRGAPDRDGLLLLALGEPRTASERRRWEALLEALADQGLSPWKVDEPHPVPWIHALGLAYLGDWVSVHLARRLGVDPAPIDLLHDIKRRLAGGKDLAP